jgi:putative restriction endonuclease
MSKIHHAAFDANLIGIDADLRVHVAEELLAMNDGPMLEQGIKAMAGHISRLPKRSMDNPDRDRLAQRFELFIR